MLHDATFGAIVIQSFNKKHKTHLKTYLFRFVGPRGSFCLTSQGWGGEAGGVSFETFLRLLNKKDGSHLNIFLLRFFCLVTVFLPSRGWGGGGGSIWTIL